MREIKFRAWDDQQTCMIYPNQGIVNNMQSWEILQRFDTVMQYTGLKDKNGKEIYEGDLLRHEYEKGIAVVKFGEGYQGEPADGMYPYWGWYADGWFEQYAFDSADVDVKGNIYENPKLLKG